MMNKCYCGRQSRGIGWTNYKEPFDKKYHWFCSKKHYDLWKEDKLSDFTKFEIAALLKAGEMAGEYMSEIKKTDLREFTKDEWLTLLKIIYGSTCANIVTEKLDDEPPFK